MPGTSFEELEADVLGQTLAAEADAVQLLDDLILLSNRGTTAFVGQQHDRGLNFLVSLIAGRAFNTLWRAREDAVRGYYVQALGLCRSALDDWITIEWVEADPERRFLFLSSILREVDHPKNERGREIRVPQTSRMLDDLGQSDSEVKVAHDLLSKFAHPRGLSLRWQVDWDTKTSTIRAGGRFDARDLRETVSFLVRTAAGILPAIERLQVRWLGESDAKFVEDANTKVGAAIELLRSYAADFNSDR